MLLALLMFVPNNVNSASFGSRAMALTIDFVLLEVIYFFLFILLTAKFIQAAHFEPLTMAALFVLYLLVFFGSFIFLHMVYFTLFHAWSGQTIGKMVMGIKVVTHENKPASTSIAFLRWSGYILSIAPLATGFLWAAVDKDQCAWHDRLAQTRVISSEMT
jgi:uncharacterized RDD family membrane protein YckC